LKKSPIRDRRALGFKRPVSQGEAGSERKFDSFSQSRNESFQGLKFKQRHLLPEECLNTTPRCFSKEVTLDPQKVNLGFSI
jgi:hypothetical protein